MTQLVLVALASCAGFAGYTEAVRFTKRTGKRLLWCTPWQIAPACAVVALAVGWFAAPLVLGALFGLVGYNQAGRFKQQTGDALLDLPAIVWAAANAFVGCLGAAITSTVIWSVVCAFLALAATLLLLLNERSRLLAENTMWVGENRRLLAEKNAKQPAPAAASAPAPAVAPAQAAPAPAAQQSQWQSPPASPYRHLDLTPAAAPTAPAAPPVRGNGIDMLPRR